MLKLVLTCLFLLMAVEVYYAPYTKVEESFNMQAIHDILKRSSHFDHLDFPGVVPRTFLGATLLSALAYPFTLLFPGLSSLQLQILVRILLSGTNVLALGEFLSGGVRDLFGQTTANITAMLFLCQFHLVFWGSRTLPNMLALPWVLLGLSHWLSSKAQQSGRKEHLEWMIRYFAFAGVVFRFEAGILMVILIISESLFVGGITWKNAVKQSMVTAFISLILTVPLDSYFWEKLIWPEGMVFYFNAILNKSSAWGTLPFNTYFGRFLPLLLLISYPLSLVRYSADVRVGRILTPMVAYILLFSFLPHKEWRFIIYTVPVFTVAAGVSVNSFYTRRTWIYKLALIVSILGALASFVVSLTMFSISRLNYPGGQALAHLHELEKNTIVHVHLDTEAAMTGVTLFGQYHPFWIYSKNETHISEQDFLDARYTHLIRAPYSYNKELFELIDTTEGIEKIGLKPIPEIIQSIRSLQPVSPLNVQMTPKLYTLRLKNPEKTWIKHTVNKHPVVLYSKSYCGYCRAAKGLISKYCQHIEIIEVDQQNDASAIQRGLIELTGQRTFPNLFKNGVSLGGFDRLSALDREGKLSDLCTK